MTSIRSAQQLGEALRAARKQLGLTQSQLALGAVVSVRFSRPLPVAPAELEDRAAEEGEAELVVPEVPIAVSVNSLPVEERRVLDENHAKVGRQLPFIETGASMHIVDGHMNRADKPARREGDRPVPRQEAQNLVRARRQRLGQSRRDVRAPARLGVGRHLR